MTEDEPFDPQLFDTLEREAPVLVRLRRFAMGLDRLPWLSRLGEPPNPAVRDAAQAYVDRLGFPEAALAILPTWEDALEAAETNDWSSPGWEAEELLRSDLTERALSVVSAEGLGVGLKLVAQFAADSARPAADEQAAWWDIDEGVARDLAVGAVAQVCHGAALALIAAAADPELDADDHAFAWKYRLCALGRWPVSVVGNTFSVF
jgi:hypothetical protein